MSPAAGFPGDVGTRTTRAIHSEPHQRLELDGGLASRLINALANDCGDKTSWMHGHPDPRVETGLDAVERVGRAQQRGKPARPCPGLP